MLKRFKAHLLHYNPSDSCNNKRLYRDFFMMFKDLYCNYVQKNEKTVRHNCSVLLV